MNYYFLLGVVVASFGVIHMLEVTSFLARISGVAAASNTFGYALQNAVFMCTRFFTMMLLPLLGYAIDIQVSKKEYLLTVHLSLLFALLLAGLALVLRKKLAGCFVMIIGSVRDGQDLMKSLMKLPLYFLSCKSVDIPLKGIRYYALRNSIFAQSVAIFMVYALSTFLAFYFGLVFPDYRTSLSQMSAVTNAFATVLLTFYVEPKISLAIDRDGEVVDNIMALLCGRLVGVGLLSHFFLMPLWMLV